MTASETMTSLGAALAPHYALERELGRGGMATVYLARDLRLNRPVALKVLRPELVGSLGPERFQREIHLVARLSHPNILALFDSGEVCGRLWYTMPYVDGESLRQRLGREAQLDISEAVRIARQVAGALDHAHQHGIIHRDIKPENILLTGDQALVADFGIAKALDEAGGDKLTATGLSLGTPAYMSPEQGSGGRVDARSDVYALGCVVYEMLAGAPPFAGPTAQSILARHAVDPVPPLRTVRAQLPPAVERAVERALAKVPADRFAAAAEFAEALVVNQAPGSTVRGRLSTRSARRSLGIIVGAAMLGMAAWAVRGRSTPIVVPSAASIAVLPLVSTASDTGLVRLGRDLAVTISASLDGVGGIETADRLGVANATHNRSSLSPGDGAALARKLGATSILRGTLVGAGDNVRLDVGLYATEGLAPLAEGITVVAPRDSIGMLTDSVSWTLLRQVWRRGQPPSPSLEAVTTRSIPALRAFLEGEHALGANEWDRAALGYRGAIALDSAFWLAHFRYALTQVWTMQPLEPEVMEILRLHRDAFPEPERLLVAPLLDSMAPLARLEQLRRVTERFPEYWPGWFVFADMLYHWGLNSGHDWSEVLYAFQRVVALNPRLAPAWAHIFELTGRLDPSASLGALDSLNQLGWPAPDNLLIPLIGGITRANGVIPPELMGMADSLAEFAASSPNQYVSKYGAAPGVSLLRWGFPAAQLQLNYSSLNSERIFSPRIRTALQAANAWAWAARGRWDSALTILAAVAHERPGVIGQSRYSPPLYPPLGGPVLAIESYGIAVLGAWLGATEADLADRRCPAAVAAIGLLDEEESRRDARARIAWLDGLLAFARKDRRAMEAARAEALRSGYYQAPLVDRSLAAFDRALQGDRVRAGQELAEIEEHCVSQDYCNHFTPHIAVHRLAAAQWLQEAGDLERAARLLRWQDAVNWPTWGGIQWMVNDALRAPTYLVRARVEEARGHPELAGKYYRLFLSGFDQPMPSEAHLVAEAKEALVRLGEVP